MTQEACTTTLLDEVDLVEQLYDCNFSSRVKLKKVSKDIIFYLAKKAPDGGKIRLNQEKLGKAIGVERETVSRGTKELKEKNFIQTSDSNGFTLSYNLSDFFFEQLDLFCSTCDFSSQHEYDDNNKAINTNNSHHEQRKKITPQDRYEYKQVLDKLESWGYNGGKFAIKRHGISKVKELIVKTEQFNPANKGAYLRTLLGLPDNVSGNDDSLKPLENGFIPKTPLEKQYAESVFSKLTLEQCKDWKLMDPKDKEAWLIKKERSFKNLANDISTGSNDSKNDDLNNGSEENKAPKYRDMGDMYDTREEAIIYLRPLLRFPDYINKPSNSRLMKKFNITVEDLLNDD